MQYQEAFELYQLPLLELIQRSAKTHRQHFNPNEIQTSALVSIKTGGCSEDCSYCPQSAKYSTKINVEKLMSVEEVQLQGEEAKASGAGRLCLGAAWREVRDNRDFDKILEMIRGVRAINMEVCCTLGMISQDQAQKLAEAGLTAYNHNIDTSREFYDKVITTRTFDDRLQTLRYAREAGIALCSGGIIGMGESIKDRINMLVTLSEMNPPPESVPINVLVPIEGTPLSNNEEVPVWDLLRIIALARIMMPKSYVRLSAGREKMKKEAQALCFYAGANSVFLGDKLLTSSNCSLNEDMELFNLLGLKIKSN